MLRTALTSISKVNKTDVETLRTSFGVSAVFLSCHLIADTNPDSRQSFAAISRASSEQLQNLPGFGQVKAKRIQDAFNKPFRNNSTSALPASTQLQLRATQQSAEASNGKAQDLEVDDTDAGEHVPRAPTPPRPPPAPRPRAPSPTWDIELDLNESSPEPTPESGPPPVRKRPPSPVWDIELDLNATDEEDEGLGERERKRPREGSGDFGAPSMLMDV